MFTEASPLASKLFLAVGHWQVRGWNHSVEEGEKRRRDRDREKERRGLGERLQGHLLAVLFACQQVVLCFDKMRKKE